MLKCKGVPQLISVFLDFPSILRLCAVSQFWSQQTHSVHGAVVVQSQRELELVQLLSEKEWDFQHLVMVGSEGALSFCAKKMTIIEPICKKMISFTPWKKMDSLEVSNQLSKSAHHSFKSVKWKDLSLVSFDLKTGWHNDVCRIIKEWDLSLCERLSVDGLIDLSGVHLPELRTLCVNFHATSVTGSSEGLPNAPKLQEIVSCQCIVPQLAGQHIETLRLTACGRKDLDLSDVCFKCLDVKRLILDGEIRNWSFLKRIRKVRNLKQVSIGFDKHTRWEARNNLHWHFVHKQKISHICVVIAPHETVSCEGAIVWDFDVARSPW